MVQMLDFPKTLFTGIFCHWNVFIFDLGLGMLICGRVGTGTSKEALPGGGGGGGGPPPNPGGGGGGGGGDGAADIAGSCD